MLVRGLYSQNDSIRNVPGIKTKYKLEQKAMDQRIKVTSIFLL